jgi:hypothetical protein
MDCLPEIIMPEPKEEETPPNVSMNVEELDKTRSEIEASEDEEEEEVKPIPKKKMEQTDIFSDAPKVKPVKEKKKRVLSEEHKQKLAMARQKALEVRRENSRQKKEMKELTKLKKTQELDKLREETGRTKKIEKKPDPPSPKPVREDIPPPIPKTNIPVQQRVYSQEDMERASLNAILGYEKIRKDRKTKKKQAEQLDRQQEQLKQQLRNIKKTTTPSYEDNEWSNFF